jgi:hypothetical protein
VAVSFEGLEGIAPDFAASAPTLSDSHGYFGFIRLESSPFTNDITFGSVTLTGTVVPQYSGLGELKFVPHHESRLSLVYTTPGTNDPGRFVSLVSDPHRAPHHRHAHGTRRSGQSFRARAGGPNDRRGTLDRSASLVPDPHQRLALHTH